MKLALISFAVLALTMGCKSNRYTFSHDGLGGAGGEKLTGDEDGDGTGGKKTVGDGDGDTDPEPECVNALDCPASDACNAAATCEDGECVAGTSGCGKFDSENCACVDVDGDCAVQGADADEDGAKSALCETHPGDDCDDAQPTVYPGAEEVCDGIDNDCNGLRDLDDGLEPYVRRVDIPDLGSGGTARLAWSSTAKAYATVWVTESIKAGLASEYVNFGLIGLDGSFTETLPSMLQSGLEADFLHLAVENGEKEIAIAAVASEVDVKPVVHVRRIARTGTATIGAVITLPTSLDSVDDLWLVSTGPDDWHIVYSGYQGAERKTYLTRLHEGAVVSRTAETLLKESMEGFAKSSGVLVPWSLQVGTERAFKWSAYDAGSVDPIAQGTFGSGSEYYFGFSSPGDRLGSVNIDWMSETAQFSSVNARGWECQGVAVPYRLGYPAGPVSLPDGWALVSQQAGTYGSSDLYFSRVYSDCTASVGVAEQAFSFANDEYAGSMSAQSFGNGKGFAVAWSAHTIDGFQSRVGLFGPNICDDPDQ